MMFEREPISPEKLDEYRRMTPGQRLAIALEMTEEAWPKLFEGTPEEVDRRFEEINREHDLSNENILKAFARLKRAEEAERQSQT
jgi:phage terminase Nu1 subunit (DNA packaging protein)